MAHLTLASGVALVCGLASACGDSAAAQSPPASARIAAAVVPLPASLRAGAGVVALDGDGPPHPLRPSANGMVCIADAPEDASFNVECYHTSFIPVVYRMKQLVAAGLPEAVLDRTIDGEIRDGILKLPSGPTIGYLMFGPVSGYDTSTNTVSNAIERGHRLFVPYSTPGALGLPTDDDGIHPYLMAAGTYYAHVMLVRPPLAPLTPNQCRDQMGLLGRPIWPTDSALTSASHRPSRD